FVPHDDQQDMLSSRQQQSAPVEEFSPNIAQNSELQFQGTSRFDHDILVASQRRRYSMPTLHISIPAQK
ncbi:hypothetical protein BGZ81_010244, partial [Podila clonocystis]